MKLLHVFGSIAVATALSAAPALAQDLPAPLPEAQTIDVRAPLDAAQAHAALDPYGEWVQHGTYGDVWIPSSSAVGADFVPYGTNGRWVSTDAGWYWQSDLPWGWVAFHYGNWVQLDSTWAWVRGDTFAPAWVDWRTTSNGLIGWAPLSPFGLPAPSNYAYLQPGMLGLSDFWSSAIYGPRSVPYYQGSYSLPRARGFGRAIYAFGPRFVAGAAVTPLGRAWQRDLSRSRSPVVLGYRPVEPAPMVGGRAPVAIAPVAVAHDGTEAMYPHYGRPVGGYRSGGSYGGFRGGHFGGGFHGGRR